MQELRPHRNRREVGTKSSALAPIFRASTGNEPAHSEPWVPCASRAPVSLAADGLLRISVDFSGLERAVTVTVRFRLSKRIDAETRMGGAEGEGFEPSKSLHP